MALIGEHTRGAASLAVFSKTGCNVQARCQTLFTALTISSHVRSDPDIVLAAVKADGLALEHASQELRDTESIVLAAVFWSF